MAGVEDSKVKLGGQGNSTSLSPRQNACLLHKSVKG